MAKTSLQRLEAAKNKVSRAECELERLMGQIDEAPRAQKMTVSRVLEEAFSVLRSAKEDLAELETLLSGERDRKD